MKQERFIVGNFFLANSLFSMEVAQSLEILTASSISGDFKRRSLHIDHLYNSLTQKPIDEQWEKKNASAIFDYVCQLLITFSITNFSKNLNIIHLDSTLVFK